MLSDNTGQKIALVVAGVQCDLWDDVTVDLQIDVPADAWSMSLLNPPIGGLPASIQGGASCQLYYGNELILTGFIDRIKMRSDRGGLSINVSGRDMAGQLIDCSAPLVNAKQLNMIEIITTIMGGAFSPISDMQIYSDDPLELFQSSVSIEPGESIWDALVKSAATRGQWVWFGATGMLMIGNPFATPLQVKQPIKLMYAGSDNNAISLEYTEDVSSVYSHIKLISQDDSANSLLAESVSKSPYPHPRLKIISMPDIANQAEAQAVLNKIQRDNDLEAYSLTAVLAGWTVDGQSWQQGVEVTVQSDVIPRANARWVVMGRTFRLSRADGKTTILELKRKGDWAQPLIYKEPAKDKKADSGLDDQGRGTYQGDEE
jgi:prophage tail gpP-like protein